MASIFNDLPTTVESEEAIKAQSKAAAVVPEQQQQTTQAETAPAEGGPDLMNMIQSGLQNLPNLDQAKEMLGQVNDAVTPMATSLANPVGGLVGKTTELINQGAEALGVDVPELYDNKITDLASDAANLPTIAGGQVADQIAGIVKMPQDIFEGALSEFGLIDKADSEIPWSAQYEMANYDIGSAEARTEVGDMAATMLKYMAVGTATGGAGILTQMAADGGMDFLEDPGEGNISNFAEDAGMSNPILDILAHDETDSDFTRRFRNSLEGAVPAIGVLSARQSVKALKAMRTAVWGGSTLEEGAEIAADIMKQAPDDDAISRVAREENAEISGRPAPTQVARTPEEIEAAVAEYKALDEEVIRLVDNAEEEAAGPLMDQMKDVLNRLPLNKQIEINGGLTREVDLGSKATGNIDVVADDADFSVPTEGPEIDARLQEVFGDELDTMSPEEIIKQKALIAQELGINTPVFDVMWDAKGEPGTAGLLKVNRELQKVFGELEAGTVVRNLPADDSYSAKGQSEAQFRRAGDITAKGEAAQFERFKAKMDGQYPLTIGEGYNAVTFKDVEAHFRGLSARARQSIVGPAEDALTNARSRLYERAGFGPLLVGDGGYQYQYGVVRGNPQGRRWIEPVEDLSEIPSMQKRLRDEAIQGKPPSVDPQDRVSQVFKAESTNESAASFWDSPNPGGGDSLIDEVDLQSLKTVDGLKQFVDSRIPDIDVDAISRRLSKQTSEHIEATWRSLADFANSGEIDALEPLRFTTKIDVMKGAEAGGVVVLDTLVKSLADRMSILAKQASDLAELDAPFKTQAKQILDRAEALAIAKKESSQFASKGLESFKEVPPQLKRAIDADRKRLDALFSEIRQGLDSTDPVEVMEFKKSFRKMALALGASKGDPRLQMDIWEGVARVGFSRAQSVFINSLRSGPLTHVRNIAGNVVALAERPLSRAMGGGGVEAFYAFNGIHKSILEAASVAKASFSSPRAIVTTSGKVVDYAAQDRRVMENALNGAQTATEKQMAGLAMKAFDLTNNPWFNWPGKALQSGDDFTKSILARMELRYQAGLEAKAFSETSQGVSGVKQAELREQAYQRLVNEKLSPKGTILDADLMNVADAASFQRPLEGWVGQWGKAIQDAPGGRFIMPFYKTPVNITRYAVQISPLAPLSSEWRHAIRYGTPDEKAIMRGRMAVGSVIAASTAGLASQDLLTGYGPTPGPERDRWLKDHEPMSFKVGDKWVSYQALPGISLVMSAVADMTYLTGRLNNDDAGYVLGAIPFFIANAVTSQPMFQGVLNMAGLLDARSWTPDKIVKAMGEFGNNMGGGAGLRRTFEQALHTNMSEYRTWADEFIGKATAGFLGEKVDTPDILTGKSMPTKYANPANLVNPFTVVGKDRSPLLDSLDKLGFPIKLAVPDRISNVPLTPDEKAFLGKAIYDKGNFAKAIQATLATKDFEAKYNFWRSQRGSGTQVPKKDSEWYKDLAKIQSKYQHKAKLQLLESSDPISVNYRETFATRAAKASSGNGGDLTPEQMGDLRQLNDLARWGSQQ